MDLISQLEKAFKIEVTRNAGKIKIVTFDDNSDYYVVLNLNKSTKFKKIKTVKVGNKRVHHVVTLAS